MILYWTYLSSAHKTAGALSPTACDFAYGRFDRMSPYAKHSDYVERSRAVESGYQVQPSDCPPMRAMAKTGLIFRCPSLVEAEGIEYRSDRQFDDQSSSHGALRLRGVPWPGSDSGYAASWISGSQFMKIQTGIVVICPRELGLFQGPVPNSDLMPDCLQLTGYSAIEYYSSRRRVLRQGNEYFAVEMNFIYKAPDKGCHVEIRPGTPIGWALPLGLPSFSVEQFDGVIEGANRNQDR
jgi:hypothetical protein